MRATAQRLTWVLNPGPNLWSGLGCRCALSPALKPLADEVAYAAQQVFERLGCLEPLLLRNLLDTPLWTETPPAIPRDEIARLQRAISQLQAWGDRELRRP
ncbi:MAG TPA: hypothetical protein VHB77_20655 [Planctomycetaceae bacterium]|nr:hypothetical protein [Planctomycetaceae bacterium]